jgi:hypothetical protein
MIVKSQARLEVPSNDQQLLDSPSPPMSSLPPPPGLPPPGVAHPHQQQQSSMPFVDANGAGPSLTGLTSEEIEAKKRKWLNMNGKRYGESRKRKEGTEGGKTVS